MLGVVAAVYDRVMTGVEEAGLSTWRAELLAPLAGTVVEIGAGTGRNVAFYPDAVDHLVLCEPDRHMRARLAVKAATRPGTEVSEAPAEALELADASVDAVVCTLVLCSVDHPDRALAEVRRVLRPGGQFVFIEHVAADDRPRRLAWQRRVEPLWRRVAGNCHLTRTTEQAIARSGLQLHDVTRASMRKAPAVVRPTVRGVALRTS